MVLHANSKRVREVKADDKGDVEDVQAPRGFFLETGSNQGVWHAVSEKLHSKSPTPPCSI